MNEKRERQLRRSAIRLDLQGQRPKDILQSVSRSRTWFSKWRKRYQRWGWAGLDDHSRCPHHQPRRVSPRVRRLVIRVRRQLQRRHLGLVGPKAIQRELRLTGALRRPPSEATIKRILRAARLRRPTRRDPPAAYYPAPQPTPQFVIHAQDWTERYLEGGQKVYAFHSLDLESWACRQTIRPDKTYATVRAHVLRTWKTLGIPDAVRMDNDAAFSGGNKAQRCFSQFVRLCLYVGAEPIFIPVGEAARNGEVEWLNGLWGRACWQRQHFTSLRQVQRASPQFEAWYHHEYAPPRLQGRTPAQAHRRVTRRRLTEREGRPLPEKLPLTAGRMHFIRQVQAGGTIKILNETWHVNKRLAGQYVWATVWTHRQILEIYHRRSSLEKVRLVKTYPYTISESVKPLCPDFRRSHRRRKMSTML